MDRLARIGYATRGFLYVVVGLLAFEVATGIGGETTSTRGAVSFIGNRPLGTVLLALVVVGLASYALWCLVRATIRPPHRGSSAADATLRFSYLCGALWYGSLLPFAVELLAGNPGDPSSQQTTMVGRLLGSAVGRPLLLIVGLLCMAFAVWQAYDAVTAAFRRDFQRETMDASRYRLAVVIGRIGYAARGLAYALIGWFIVDALRRLDPQEVKGLDGVLQLLQRQPHGQYLLGLMGLGLVAFGLYSMIFSRYARHRGL